jgi:hypothetical protein
MKNAKRYEKEIKKFLSGIRSAQPSPPPSDPILALLEAILQEDVGRKQAGRALDLLRKEFVDLNELRVAPVKDIVDILGRDYYGAREKADSIVRSLNGLFDRFSAVSVGPMAKMPKRELRRRLLELGLSPYASAVMMMLTFGGHAIPVDRSLVECLEIEGLLPPGGTLEEIQGFFERIIPQKSAPAAHEFLRAYMEGLAKPLAKKRKADAEAAAKAKAEADQAAAEAARLKAEKEAAREARKAAKLAASLQKTKNAETARKLKKVKAAKAARKSAKG